MADSFLTELKRRHVFKVSVAYLVLAWVVIQLTSEALAEPFRLTRPFSFLAALVYPLPYLTNNKYLFSTVI